MFEPALDIRALPSGADPLGEIPNLDKPYILKSEITASLRGGVESNGRNHADHIKENTIRPDTVDEPANEWRSQATVRSRSRGFPSYGNGLLWRSMGWLVMVCMNKVGAHEGRRTA